MNFMGVPDYIVRLTNRVTYNPALWQEFWGQGAFWTNCTASDKRCEVPVIRIVSSLVAAAAAAAARKRVVFKQ